MTRRHRNHNLRKRCDCPRRLWPKCAHSWWFNYQPKGGTSFRISLDKHAAKHLDRKADAESLAATIRTEIDAGTYGQVAPISEMTLRELADVYLDRSVAVDHPASVAECRSRLNVICGTVLPRPTGGAAPFGDWRLVDVTTDTIERHREARRAAGTGLAGTNRSLARLRAMYNWAVRTGYVEHTPFKRQGEAVVRLQREAPRSRRLDGDRDEEARLLAACAPHLRALVEAALATGCRVGELLSLTWQQVVGLTIDVTKTPPVMTWAPRSEIVMLASKTKTQRDRRIPISTRLKAIVEMRALDPNGQPFASDLFVFGNAVGEQVGSIKRAWMTALLKANGVDAEYNDKANLSPKSRAAFAEINLHFHDLRREAGSRWLEGGVPLHTVRDWLGHTSIAQTSTYLSGTQQTQHGAMTAFEARLADLEAAAKAKAAAAAAKAATKPEEPFVQQCATEVKKQHRKAVSAGGRQHRTLNKNAGERQTTIM
ncbi:MAG: tyrosine-type recombinase/integrase [Acidobacteria bacterium]|nr:tyrosine-type recombinase/integrase [Acidobacteriota bacterium]